jgi:hypothetical protein
VDRLPFVLMTDGNANVGRGPSSFIQHPKASGVPPSGSTTVSAIDQKIQYLLDYLPLPQRSLSQIISSPSFSHQMGELTTIHPYSSIPLPGPSFEFPCLLAIWGSSTRKSSQVDKEGVCLCPP